MGIRKIQFTLDETAKITPLLNNRREYCLRQENEVYKSRVLIIDKVLNKFSDVYTDRYTPKECSLINSCIEIYFPIQDKINEFRSLVPLAYVNFSPEEKKEINNLELLLSIMKKTGNYKRDFSFNQVFKNIERLKKFDFVFCSISNEKIYKLGFSYKTEVVTIPLSGNTNICELVWSKKTKVKLKVFSEMFMQKLNRSECRNTILKYTFDCDSNLEKFIKYIIIE